ncbi:MAG: FAD-dependent oxidoreductase, partial [Methyloligellaceae bacterium]
VLEGIDLDYSWWGWVDVSHDMMPRIYQPDRREEVFYAMGYGGNGVMYSAQAGRRMAQLVAGRSVKPELPIFASALPHHGVLTPFRRVGQRFLYHWYHYRDERGRDKTRQAEESRNEKRRNESDRNARVRDERDRDERAG